ncbi:MAG: GNAT family N-acetyltransferase [Acidobacteriia bacterium]|nr:GNAT family N-acetyltransferase [Terriglobia bacterium]
MAQPDATFRIDPATPADVPLILALIRELADYEKLLDDVVATEAMIHEALFGDTPHAEAVVARAGDEPVGFALYFHTFSTFLARPGLYLEDLYVRPEHRGNGYGRRLLVHLARIAVERNTTVWRFEFYDCWDLDTNRWIDAFAKELTTFRPHQTLDGKTPSQYLQQLTTQEDLPLISPERA